MIEHVDPPLDAASPAGPELRLLPAILDAVADGVTVQDRTGRLVYANDTAVRMIGFADLPELLAASPEEVMSRFRLIDTGGNEIRVADLPGRRVLEDRPADTLVVGYSVVPAGEIRWSQVRATALRDATGRVTHAINTFHDVTDRVRVEADLRASEASYRQLVEAMPQVAWTTDADGRVVMVNERWREYAGPGREPGDGLETDDGVHPDDRPELEHRWAESLRSGAPLEATVRILRRDRVYRWHLVRAMPMRRSDGAIGGWIGTSTDIDDERRSKVASTLLAEAAERLDESLDPHQTAQAAASIAIPALADWCVIELLRPDGSLVREVVAAQGWSSDLVDRVKAYPADPAGQAPVARALREGRSITSVVDAAFIASFALNEEHAATMRETGARHILAVPLLARGRSLGAMLLARTRADAPFDPAAVGLAEELAHRVALALSNADLYAAEQAAREDAEVAAARMAALQRTTRTLAAAATSGEVAGLATKDTAAALGAAASVLYVATEGDRLELVSAHGYDRETLAPLAVLDADSPLPVARAYRERRAVWTAEADSEIELDERARGRRAGPGNASLAAIPLAVGDRTVGVLGLAFRTRDAFESVDRALTVAQANVLAQAIERVALSEARERLLGDLESQRNRLEAVLRQMPAGVLIADADGTVVLSNGRAGEIWRAPIEPGRRLDEYDELVAFTADGRRVTTDDWPLARALRAGETITGLEMEVVRADATQAWVSVDGAPIRDRDGNIVAAVSTFSDVTAERLATRQQAFLAEASAVLASSLDYEETVARVMQLAVPRIADWALVDLVTPEGVLELLAVAHADPAKEELARELRRRYPPSIDAPTGSGAVARTGRPELMPEMTEEAIEAIPDPELRGIVRELRIRSYIVVPLIAGGETLGVMTFVGAESGRRYGEDELRLAQALAARAASAIENARLFRDVARFKAVLDATLDAVFLFDSQGERIVYANQGAVDQLGWQRADLLGMAPGDLVADRAQRRLRDVLSPLVAGAAGSRTTTLALQHRDGRRVPVEMLLQHVELPRGESRVVAIARDITERVEAQARLQRLAEAEHARAAELNAVIRAMGEGVVVCDTAGRVVLANPAAEHIFPRLAGARYADVIGWLDDPDGEAPRLGERGGPVELRVLGDEERWVELSTYPVAPREGLGQAGAAETIALLRDVTASRQRQAVRDTFIGVLSHELRTPVTTIYAGSKVLARGERLDAETRRSIFEDIHIEAERLHRLVEDVIALRRFGEEDRGEIGREPVLLQRILPTVVRSEEARWPGVTFQLSVPGGIPTVVADATYVEQVVRNLLSNAAKYGGPGSSVEASVEAGDDEVLVRILDNGPGFPADEGDRLFDLFFRSPSTAGAASGAGIGLFVCARLVRAMGGRIWARPRPAGGAEFGFALRTMDDESA